MRKKNKYLRTNSFYDFIYYNVGTLIVELANKQFYTNSVQTLQIAIKNFCEITVQSQKYDK